MLFDLLQHLSPWIQSVDELERTRAMRTFVGMLKAYMSHSESDEASRQLPLQGEILGRMVPRCSDPSLFIRQTAMDCIQLTLRVATCTPGTHNTVVHCLHAHNYHMSITIVRYPGPVGGCSELAA